MSLIEHAVRVWRHPLAKSTQFGTYDVIVPISYGATRTDLTRATQENFQLAITHWSATPKALIVYGNCPYLYPGAEIVEHEPKIKILRRHRVPSDRIVYAGLLMNSISEGIIVKQALWLLGINPARILVVTGEMHTRSAFLLYQRKLFPRARVSIAYTPWHYEFQPDHPAHAQHGPWRWLNANLRRQAALRVAGPYWRKFASIHHRTSAT